MKPTKAQLATLHELVSEARLQLDGLDVRLTADAHGALALRLADRWGVDHYRIDRRGLATAPMPSGRTNRYDQATTAPNGGGGVAPAL